MDTASGPRRRLPPVLLGLLVAYLLVDLGVLAFATWADVHDFRDPRYPDSATLLVVARAAQSGPLYPDLNRPPYQVTPYGPLYYSLLSGPYRLAVKLGRNPVVFVRLAIVAFFLGCLGAIVLITRRVSGSAGAGLLAALLAAERMWEGGAATVALRPDLVGLCLALLGVLLCLHEERRGFVTAAAVAAGLALVCKQTFVAAPAAIVLWYLWRRRFRTAAWCAAVAGLSVAGGYALFIWREPLILQHFRAISRPLLEYREAPSFVLDAGRRLAAPLLFLGIPFLWRRRDPRTVLLLCYALLAWGVAGVTILQAGGATNYFYEPLMVSAPLATLVLLRLDREQRQGSVALVTLLAFLTVGYLTPQMTRATSEAKEIYELKVRGYATTRAAWERLRSVLAGRRLLALNPDVTMWSSVPELTDPYLMSVVERKGKWSYAPVIRELDQGTYEAVVLPPGWLGDMLRFRGVEHWPPAVVAAVRRRYAVACVMAGQEVRLPASGSELKQALLRAGCAEPDREQPPR